MWRKSNSKVETNDEFDRMKQWKSPSAKSSTASESLVKTRHESQSPLSPQVEEHDRTERPVVCSQRASQTRFSREYKNDILEEEENNDRTVRPVVCFERAHQFVVENDETKSDLSLGSRSFLHRVNDQVRKRQNQSSNDATKDSDKHSVIFRMFMSSTLKASVFMEKNYSDIFAFHQKYRRSHNETGVRHIWAIDNRTIRRDLWNKYN